MTQHVSVLGYAAGYGASNGDLKRFGMVARQCQCNRTGNEQFSRNRLWHSGSSDCAIFRQKRYYPPIIKKGFTEDATRASAPCRIICFEHDLSDIFVCFAK